MQFVLVVKCIKQNAIKFITIFDVVLILTFVNNIFVSAVSNQK